MLLYFKRNNKLNIHNKSYAQLHNTYGLVKLEQFINKENIGLLLLMATNEYLITLERNSIMEAFVATKQNKKKKRKLTNFDVSMLPKICKTNIFTHEENVNNIYVNVCANF